MIDAIFIAQTGLKGFESGLRAIAHNTANINTPGFKGSTTRFSDLFYGQSGLSGNLARFGQFGNGLCTLGTTLNFQQGQLQNTGNPLDLAIGGQGFFTLRDSNGNIHYTQDGQFKFDSDSNLVSVTTGEQVMGLDAGGNLVPISLTNLQTNAARATSTITFSGNLSSSATTHTIGSVTVIDSAGTSHSLSVNLTPVVGTPGSWTATVMDGTTTVGTGNLVFQNGLPTAGSNTISLTYTPNGGAAIPLTLDFSTNVTSFDSGSSSSLVVARQNGFGIGVLTQATFDAAGTLVLTYSNGQTVRSRQLALGQFNSDDDVAAIGSNQFEAKNGHAWQVGVAGSGPFGKIQSGQVEMSNVDLSQEFSNLVIMQRGYQACSQVVATSNEMLTTLFGVMTR